MICKNCGALIKHNEEYCKKCGYLLIKFQQREDKSLRNICIENNLRGKLRGLSNKISNEDKKLHNVEKASEKINSNHGNITDIGDTINKYVNKYVEDEPRNSEKKKGLNNENRSVSKENKGSTFTFESLKDKKISNIIGFIVVAIIIIMSLLNG